MKLISNQKLRNLRNYMRYSKASVSTLKDREVARVYNVSAETVTRMRQIILKEDYLSQLKERNKTKRAINPRSRKRESIAVCNG